MILTIYYLDGEKNGLKIVSLFQSYPHGLKYKSAKNINL